MESESRGGSPRPSVSRRDREAAEDKFIRSPRLQHLPEAIEEKARSPRSSNGVCRFQAETKAADSPLSPLKGKECREVKECKEVERPGSPTLSPGSPTLSPSPTRSSIHLKEWKSEISMGDEDCQVLKKSKSEISAGDKVSIGDKASEVQLQDNKDRGKGARGSLESGSSDLMKELFQALSRVRVRTELQKMTWSFLEDPDLVPGGRVFMRFMAVAILISAVIPVIQTIEPPPFEKSRVTFVEIFLDSIFAIEVVMRLYTCPNRLVFCLSFYNLVDISAIFLVIFVRSFSNFSLVEADSEGRASLTIMICALPVLRLLKLLRRFETFHLILKAFRLASEALPVLLFILAVLVLVFASMIYIVEPRNNIESLPMALWLTIVTVGTIGYGDIVPKSTAGSVVVSILVIVSALYMAIPIGIVGKAFATVWDDRDRLLLMYRTRSRFLSSGYKASDVPAMFFSFDTDGDGQLSLDEFLAMMTQLQIEISGARLVELFQTFDGDGSGAIDDHEFVRTLFPSAYAEIYGKPQDGSMDEPTTPASGVGGWDLTKNHW